MRALTHRFSVVIANHNQGVWLQAAIASAMAQANPALLDEVIVVDDGSTDNSRERLDRLQARMGPQGSGPPLIVIAQQQLGQAGAWHRGVAAARGEYIALLDADDMFDPDKLQAMNEALISHPGLRFLIHNVRVRDESADRNLERLLLPVPMGQGKSVLRLVDRPEALSFPVPCGVVLRRDIAQSLLEAMPRDDWRQGADGTLTLATWLTVGEVGIIDRPLATYRIHGTNHFGRIDEGRLSALPRGQHRTPKRLAFCERLIDELELSAEHRRAAQEAIAQVARAQRLRSNSPTTAGDRAQVDQIVLPAGQALLATIAAKVRESPASLVQFARECDQVHPWFRERMAHWHATLPALVVGCDFALHRPDGHRLREHVLLTQGRSTRGHWTWPAFPVWQPWPLGPLSTLSLRLTPLTRAWVAHCDRRASPHARRFPSILLAAGGWALGGAALADEAWVSVEHADEDVLVALSAGEVLCDEPQGALNESFAWLDLPLLLLGFVIEADPSLRARLPGGWIRSLGRWARDRLPASLAQRMAVHADQARLPELSQRLRGPVSSPSSH